LVDAEGEVEAAAGEYYYEGGDDHDDGFPVQSLVEDAGDMGGE
jgi:hypothetical protein